MEHLGHSPSRSLALLRFFSFILCLQRLTDAQYGMGHTSLLAYFYTSHVERNKEMGEKRQKAVQCGGVWTQKSMQIFLRGMGLIHG